LSFQRISHRRAADYRILQVHAKNIGEAFRTGRPQLQGPAVAHWRQPAKLYAAPADFGANTAGHVIAAFAPAATAAFYIS